MMQDMELDQFGETVLGRVTPFLAQQGFAVYLDPDRVDAVHAVDWSDVWSVRISLWWNTLTTVTTAWVDRRGARSGGLTPPHLFRSADYAQVVATLNHDAIDEGYLFVVVRVTRGSSWVFIKYPVVRVTLLVADSQGTEVLRAQGIGSGTREWFQLNRTSTSLTRGLNTAMDQLERTAPRAIRQHAR